MQKATFNDIFLQILDIIHYPNNKEKFIHEFEMLNQLDAMAAIIDQYPVALQEKLKQCKSASELEHYVDKNEYKESYARTAKKAFHEFINAIADTLSNDQKKQIAQLITSS